MAWSDFDRFEDLIGKYMPARGEGETMASQACTAVNKLVYKWFNDGDVYDNVHSNLSGWANDLSSYANWLAKNLRRDLAEPLFRIKGVSSDEEYEDILFCLADRIIRDDVLEELAEEKATGTIYECDGPFEFEEEEEDWEDDEYYEEEDEEEDEEDEED